jgi:hypothetical protein
MDSPVKSFISGLLQKSSRYIHGKVLTKEVYIGANNTVKIFNFKKKKVKSKEIRRCFK